MFEREGVLIFYLKSLLKKGPARTPVALSSATVIVMTRSVQFAKHSRSPLAVVGHTSFFRTKFRTFCLVPDVRPRRLRSADAHTLLVSRTRTNLGDRAYSAAGPRVLNYICRRTSDSRICQYIGKCLVNHIILAC